MNIGDCYRLLGLKSGADLAEVKASYRRLAMQYHPDVNAGDQQAQVKFIEVTEAYKFLYYHDSHVLPAAAPRTGVTPQTPEPSVTSPVRVTRQTPVESSSNLSKDPKLKQTCYQQLQQLLKHQQFLRAIALVEGLAQRLPQDLEVRQWQAITYQCWGRHLINQKQLDKARIYLKKALRTDPHNKSLWAEVERDFRHIEQTF